MRMHTCKVMVKICMPVMLLVACTVIHRRSREQPVILPPEEMYGQLFHDVQKDTAIFSDSKTFVDCIPRQYPDVIREEYSRLSNRTHAGLRQFVNDHFIMPTDPGSYQADSLSIEQHITTLWDILKRPPDTKISGTRIPLPNAYIVPGGRFREVYYWDSYFTMLGLQVDGKTGLMKNIVDNFAWLIENYGFIPNGNRTYYLSRSQPPFFSKMVELLVEYGDSSLLSLYIPTLEKEYAFWMDGTERVTGAGTAYRRVVKLANDEVLNRYWDDASIPRSESYREDSMTAREAVHADTTKTLAEVYRNLRAGAESGWDYSSRWLEADAMGDYHLYTIRTTDILPVDLNALLFHLERLLYSYYQKMGTQEKVLQFKNASERRRNALYRYCWNSDRGFFFDYNFKDRCQTSVISAAGIYPLFFRIADSADACAAARIIEAQLMHPGGIAATVHATGQQWDSPNGWAPLQWIAISGLHNYGIDSLADEITSRWCAINRKVYTKNFKMCEKYNVVDTAKESGGGEYPTQDGFGWTNGVFKKICTSCN